MSEPRYESGKAGQFLLATVVTNFSKWDVTIDKTRANATDSSGYDPVSKQTWRKSTGGSIGGSGSIEGFFDFDAGSSAVLTALLSDDPIAAVFKYDATTTFMSGKIVLKNFKSGVESEGGTTVGFSCDFDTYGVMTFFS